MGRTRLKPQAETPPARPVASPGGGLSGPDEAGRGDCRRQVPPLRRKTIKTIKEV